ncbi:spore germination protein KA [Thermoactinomyces sp. DSM 45891]|uniref:spore germination protein n=1 Tax=Thermoactinomyces sp. DSM 45891 TaxID=1761907 RepID=UPI00091C1BAF|nr:spore germination protein [Thermoactinomyces sp. DSM 45891]SFX55189.1 spore germination protein KA [Thermoactinomyces sp. DSM 45891]
MLPINEIDPKAFVNQIVNTLQNPPDLVNHVFVVSPSLHGHCIFIETLVDKHKIEHELLHFLTEESLDNELRSSRDIINVLKYRLPLSSIKETTDLNHCIQKLLSGWCLLVIEHTRQVLLLDIFQAPHRNVSEPLMESTVQGPQEGFTESIEINLALLRKRVKNVHLRIEQFIIGTETETKVRLLYLEHLAPAEVVGEFRKRIRSIETDSILDSAYIEEWIQDRTISPFSTLLKTERPDVLASHLLEGRVGVLVDGTPDALMGPVTFFQFFSTPDDYYQRSHIATLLRWLRILSFILAILVPSLYIAILTYHQELLPHSLLINLSAQREGVPFPTLLEAVIMMLTFEVLREAGLRMPRIAGQAISIVGALVLGEAAVAAGLVAASMVIVVSITAISNFVAPSYKFGITQRIIQFSYMALAGFMGLFGVLCGVLFTVVHLASIKSFGVPYLSPLAPSKLSDWKDVFVRVPRPWMKTYPQITRKRRRRRV